MSIETVARQTLFRQSRAQGGDLRSLLNRALLRRIWRFSARHHARLRVFVALSVVGALLGVATPVLAGRVVDAITEGGSARTVVLLAVVIAAVALAETATGLLSRWLSATIGEGLILDLRTAVFDHVQRMPVAFFTRTRTGALVSRLGSDVMGAQRAFSNTLSGVVANLVTLTLTLAVMLSLSWQITLLSLLLVPLFLVPARRIGATMARLSREAAAHNATMNTQMTERFSAPGATLVKLFGDPDTESREFTRRAGRVRDIGVRTAMLQSVFMNSLTLMSALALALVYGLGGVLAIGGHLQAGTIVSLALLLTRLYAPLTALANAHVEIASALVSFERVFEVLDLKPLIREKPDAVAVPEGPVTVAFDDVRFAYPSADKVSLASLEEVAELSETDVRGGVEVLHGISFTAEPGQMIALVGSSGAGKSTIASLIARLYDVDSGAVTLNGVDVRDVSFASLKDAVGVVTQDGHLFHESIRDNLRLGAPDATDAQLWQALERARLADVVAELPDGLDTVVGERGYRLSGGQRQRLTIARLLLGRARVVVLDEATASLDSESEAAVQQALGEALAGRTSIVIAHRLSTVRAADQILVVEDGRIVERGTHLELLAHRGRYADLYETQFSGHREGHSDETEAA
ncbi:ABC transporter-like protein [Mycolicibacterium phlei]|jgi:ABC-type multidrug transport system fused ATPase/permease subunit|uniref:ABC transporter n=1 Tax=Mycolicibacterium phlei DSM 43239 = CCUG 21000 TaxID=1226750 RepID=A0A5N5UVN8_MYCPH|nr:ABC transporter ATP-binding protein [Mycolicibacterium phlei]VEG07782.1 ABC transporter-like protein [Mycobacteroides chelonae]AMO59653.1 putative ABC transporter ATP-binding protein [Mycolicibacterium phlei]EID10710.1 ABC transporter-like protein [Mycolicibacterium phlei RIVM601174]KAB7753478.1 ABC transporter [Mycolicibacterium phlei DSM 43239 = CCUG 21000]KXW62381.1 ABC transporter [Mycolicibacterium phlei DSM 43239 = CCUG 21000]